MKNIKDLSTFTENELLCALYVKEFLKENVSSEYFSYEEILSAITSKYLKKYGECHLTNEELTDWLKDNYRYPLLNDLIENEIIKIICFSQDERDTFVFDNLESIFQIITKEVRDNLLSEINYDYSKVNKETKLTDEEFRQLVTKFLKVIDPSLEWLNIYNEALENKQIHFVKADDLLEKKRLFKTLRLEEAARKIEDLTWNFTIASKNNLNIIVERNFNIKDFWAFIHEFIHFIEYKKNASKAKSLSLEEFSSITYEKLALDFLKDEGYAVEEIEKMLHLRKMNTYKTGIDIIPIFSFMNKMLINGQITKEQEMENAKRVVNLNNKLAKETKEKLKDKKPYYFSALDYSNHFCDDTIISLIMNGSIVEKEYPYIIGNYLAKLMVEKINSKELTFTDMKKIVENISIIDPNDLFLLLGVNLKKSETPKKFFLV